MSHKYFRSISLWKSILNAYIFLMFWNTIDVLRADLPLIWKPQNWKPLDFIWSLSWCTAALGLIIQDACRWMAVPAQGQRLSHLSTSESQPSLSYGFHLACDAESSDGFYSSSHFPSLFHSSTSSCSTPFSLCCCQFDWHVWELSFILRAVINACKWICASVFSFKLWLKGWLNNSLVIFWRRAIIVNRLYMIMRSILRKQQAPVYKKMLKIKWVLNSAVSQVYNKTWQHTDENMAMSQINHCSGQKSHRNDQKKMTSYWILIYSNSLLMGSVRLHLIVLEGSECWLNCSILFYCTWVRVISELKNK